MSLNYWIFFTLTLVLVTLIGYGTFATARLLRDWQPDRNLLLTPAENLLRIGLIAFALMLGRVSGVGTAQLGWVVTSLWTHLLWGIVWGVLLAGFFAWSTRWLLHKGGERYYSSVVIKAITPRNRRELILVLLAMVPVVLLEELLFRSLLIGGFRAVLPVPLLLIGWSILFGLLHSPQGRWGMIGAGLAGLLLGNLFLFSGTLLLPLVAHYVTNSAQVVYAMRLHGQEASPMEKEERDALSAG